MHNFDFIWVMIEVRSRNLKKKTYKILQFIGFWEFNSDKIGSMEKV